MESCVSYYKRILAGLRSAEPRPYTPHFHVARDRWGCRIHDGDISVGLFMNCEGFAFDLWEFSPFGPAELANPVGPGAVFDLHTVRNTCINLPFTSSKALVEGVDCPFSAMQPEWLKDAGPELHLRIAGAFAEGQRIRYDIRLCYDPTWARYRFFIDAEVWKLGPEGMEPINMMLAGALADRPEKRRWTHSLWADPQGKLKRLVHSNALFIATDFDQAVWRNKNAPQSGAWIAYAAHPTFNPVMLIHEANVPVYFATCCQLFDEHLIWQQAGLDELEEGFFHFLMKTEFANLPAELAHEFLERAQDPPRPSGWRIEKVALPFRIGQVNSFEERVDPWKPEDCPMIVLDDARDWSREEAHSGKCSLRVRGRHFHTWQRLEPCGAVCTVRPHSRSRLSAQVKTRGVERFARIELATYEYTYSNLIDIAHSAHVSGDNDWTYVEVELDNGEEAYILPRLALYGLGTAWFDDVKLESRP